MGNSYHGNEKKPKMLHNGVATNLVVPVVSPFNISYSFTLYYSTTIYQVNDAYMCTSRIFSK